MGKVYVVHCVDTEGPLNESIVATFQRIKDASGIELEPSYETLEKIQNKELNLNGYEGVLSKAFSKRIMAYNSDWTKLDKMLDLLTSDDFRKSHADSNGNGWKYTWFIMDHVDYTENPRSKITGYNQIWDHYREYYKIHSINNDEFQWHVHPANAYKLGNRCGVSYWNSPHVLESLCHRLIDRGFFPNGFRAGYHTERSDSHWLLEQYIPYDFSNQAVKPTEEEKMQADLGDGRFGDWRRARSDWGYYHPSHDDYQSEGSCNRVIFRCLNVGTRLRLITQCEVDKAFARANEGEDTLLAFCDHDFREMRYDVDEVYELIKNASKKYPDVEWINSTAVEAAKIVKKEECNPIHLDVNIDKSVTDRVKVIIETNINSFGAQPFFAIKMRGGIYRAEQLDVQIPKRKWSFTFDYDSVLAEDVMTIGIATNSREGTGALKVITMNGEKLFDRCW